MKAQPLGKSGVCVPPIIFGTSCLGNLYEVLPEATKLATVREMFRHVMPPVALDSAGKYGAGLSLEIIGTSLRALKTSPTNVVISNKLGWYRVPLQGPEPTFERGVWAGIRHDAECRISYAGILQCYEQGCQLLGDEFAPQMVSVHDPDEFLAQGGSMADILGAYRALFDLKAHGKVRAVGVGAKDWRVIRAIADVLELDWVMLACSLTVYSHPPDLLAFCAQLRARDVGIINSAVFHGGFLTGGAWFDYRKTDPTKDAKLFRWRDQFLATCRDFAVKPADACVQFSFAVPGVVAVALNTSKPERIVENVASVEAHIPRSFWQRLQQTGMLTDRLEALG